MSYPWSTYLNIPSWGEFDDFSYFESEEVQTLIKNWAETEKTKNESIGEARAVQELAFRDAIVSEKSEKIGKSEKFFWITINPSKEVELPKFVMTIKKLYSKKWIQKYVYVFENTTNGHIHSHGLIKANYEAARARKELANTVKDICLITNPHCFKFVIIDEEAAKQKLEYMLGKKQPKKLDDFQLTQQWREKEMLKPMYSSESLPILLDSREQVENNLLQ